MAKFLTIPEIIPFQEGSFTERGERVYTCLQIDWQPPFGKMQTRLINCESGVGFTEEWIADTIKGGIAALEKDYPEHTYKVVQVKANHFRIEYLGLRGMVQ